MKERVFFLVLLGNFKDKGTKLSIFPFEGQKSQYHFSR